MTPAAMIALLPESLSTDPAGLDFLTRFLAGFGAVDDLQRARIAALLTIRDPAVQTDIAIVREIAAMAGWSPDFAATVGWSDEDWRRMAALGAAVWATKGTPGSWRQALRAMTAGRGAMILDWWHRRATVGGDAWGGIALMCGVGVDDETADTYSPQESVSDVWIADPEPALDFAKIGRVLDVCRPMGERINLRRALVADGGGSFALWAVTGAGRRIVSRPTPNADSADTTDGWRRLVNATARLDLSSAVDALLVDYSLWTEIQIGAGTAVIGVLGDPDDGIRVSIGLDGVVDVSEMIAGADTSLATGGLDPLVADVSYRVRVSCVRLATPEYEIVVTVEDREAVRVVASLARTSGPVWFACGSGEVLRVGPVLLTPHGATALSLRRLGPAIPS